MLMECDSGEFLGIADVVDPVDVLPIGNEREDREQFIIHCAGGADLTVDLDQAVAQTGEAPRDAVVKPPHALTAAENLEGRDDLAAAVGHVFNVLRQQRHDSLAITRSRGSEELRQEALAGLGGNYEAWTPFAHPGQ